MRQLTIGRKGAVWLASGVLPGGVAPGGWGGSYPIITREPDHAWAGANDISGSWTWDAVEGRWTCTVTASGASTLLADCPRISWRAADLVGNDADVLTTGHVLLQDIDGTLEDGIAIVAGLCDGPDPADSESAWGGADWSESDYPARMAGHTSGTTRNSVVTSNGAITAIMVEWVAIHIQGGMALWKILVSVHRPGAGGESGNRALIFNAPTSNGTLWAEGDLHVFLAAVPLGAVSGVTVAGNVSPGIPTTRPGDYSP